jgi:hypothetical protein
MAFSMFGGINESLTLMIDYPNLPELSHRKGKEKG